MSLEELVQLYASLGGIAALVEALVAAGKRVGIIPDGSAGNVAFVLNLAGFVGFAVLNVSGVDFAGIDLLAGSIAALLMALLGLLGQVVLSGALHRSAKASSVPLLGFSHRK